MSILNSKICSGFTRHTRFSPIKRTFSYDLSYLLIHLNSQEELDQCLGFKWDSSLFFSLKNQTYLDHSKESIFSKASRFIEQYAPTISYSSIYLLTCPTFFNLNFNPVSFFYYLDKDENIIAVIAEVHNTYKQKHLYFRLMKPHDKKHHFCHLFSFQQWYIQGGSPR